MAECAGFAKSIPALFHIILSMLILTLGHYLRKLGERVTDETAWLGTVASDRISCYPQVGFNPQKEGE